MSNDLAIIDTRCTFCQQRCFVPLTTQAPLNIQRAYLDRGVNIIATCPSGQKLEKDLLGYCWTDIQTSTIEYATTPLAIEQKGETICVCR